MIAGHVADQVVGQLLVLAIVASPWVALALTGFVVGFAAGWWRQWRRLGGLRDRQTAVAQLAVRVADAEAEAARLRAELADARIETSLFRASVAAYMHSADRAHAHAAALAQDVVQLQGALQRAVDAVELAVYETELREPS
jgi:hypothetical protein